MNPVPALVLNKTRCTQAQQLTGTQDPPYWAELLPMLELYAVEIGNSQRPCRFYLSRLLEQVSERAGLTIISNRQGMLSIK